MVACHANLLKQQLELMGFGGIDILQEYIVNKEKFFKKYDVKDKKTFNKFMYDQNASFPKLQGLKKVIYENLVPALIKEHKALFNSVKVLYRKEKEYDNVEGSFLSRFLQDIEAQLVSYMFEFLSGKGFIIGAVPYDGVQVLYNEELTESVLRKCEQYVKKKSGWKIKLTFKSMETEWKPEFDDTKKEVVNYSIETMNGLYEQISADGGKDLFAYAAFMEYGNHFLAQVHGKVIAYLWRNSTEKEWLLEKRANITDVFGNLNLHMYSENDLATRYDGVMFCPDDARMKPNHFNLYVRPPMTEPPQPIEIQCPKFFDFMLNVISGYEKDKQDEIFNYYIHYMCKLVQTGFTEQILILRGVKGIGKSFLALLLSLLVGEDYYCCINNISFLEKNFNSDREKAIILNFEEIACGSAGDYHKVNQIIKDIATNTRVRVEHKGINPYMGLNWNNIIITSNNINPYNATDDERRGMITEVNPIHQNDRKYFTELMEEFKENIEYLRHYFYNKQYETDLNSLRPTTQAELDMRGMNKDDVALFCDEWLVLKGESKAIGRRSSNVFKFYTEYCRNNGYKTKNNKIFKALMNEHGYSSRRYTDGVYFMGDTERQEYCRENREACYIFQENQEASCNL